MDIGLLFLWKSRCQTKITGHRQGFSTSRPSTSRLSDRLIARRRSLVQTEQRQTLYRRPIEVPLRYHDLSSVSFIFILVWACCYFSIAPSLWYLIAECSSSLWLALPNQPLVKPLTEPHLHRHYLLKQNRWQHHLPFATAGLPVASLLCLLLDAGWYLSRNRASQFSKVGSVVAKAGGLTGMEVADEEETCMGLGL